MQRERRDREGEERDQGSSWWWGAVAAAATAVVAGGIYLASGSKEPQVESPQSRERVLQRRIESKEAPRRSLPSSEEPRRPEGGSWTSFLSNLVDGVSHLSGNEQCPGISQSCVPDNPILNNLNALLEDIYVRYIALKKEDCQLYYGVFCNIFRQITQKMEEVEPYYRKYSSRKQIAGSHFDGLRIKKPDEYDMDIVIGLPVSFKENAFDPENSDITFENKSPGYIQIKMGGQFVNLPYRDGEEWLTNKAAYEWMDQRNYLLRSKFIQWFKSVVARALNEFPLASNGRRCIQADGKLYTIHEVSNQTSPAVTCLIEDAASGFKLDVDFVPTLKFPESRWPICRGYRRIPAGSSSGDWMTVPKVNKSTESEHDQLRCWRLAFHDQEKKIMHNLYNMKQTVRLMKKLRDSQGMKAISSYYIKTLFLWEITERADPQFWRNNPGYLFKIMVTRLHAAMVEGKILYFWNKENNLIGLVPKPVLAGYAAILRRLLDVLEDPSKYKTVAKYLLSASEFSEYNWNFLHI